MYHSHSTQLLFVGFYFSPPLYLREMTSFWSMVSLIVKQLKCVIYEYYITKKTDVKKEIYTNRLKISLVSTI